ncbi:MAG: hypothetical protein JXA18_14310 [Chitinispirillaceae bacterium]|nr:hypothetical protein [Chitinispirillaceae bacterium]
MISENDMRPSSKRTDNMTPRLEFRRIPVEMLAFPQELFDARSCGHYKKPLLLVPLIVYQSGKTFTVIDGCKRLLQAKGNGMTTCDCGVLTPPPDDRHAALLRISLNRARILHFFEKLLFVRWLREHCDTKQYREMSEQLSLDNRERFEFEVLASCSREVVEAVEAGGLEGSLASEVNRLGPPNQEAVIAFFRRYPFSRQMQRELLDWLPELAFREKRTLPELFASSWLREIEQSEKLNGPQKIDRLRNAVFNRRFPTVARAKEVWNGLAAKLNPDRRRVTFKPSEAFEKNQLALSISIASADQAKQIFNSLAALPEEQWDRLIYPAQLFNAGGNGR